MCVAYGYVCHYIDGRVPSASPQVQQVGETSPDTESRPFVLPGIHRNEQPQPINTQNVTSQNIVDPTKSRYTIQHSAVAFPAVLVSNSDQLILHAYIPSLGIAESDRKKIQTHMSFFLI